MNIKNNLWLLVFLLMTSCSIFMPGFDGPDMKMKHSIKDGKILCGEFTIEGNNIPRETQLRINKQLFDLLFIETDLDVVNEQPIIDSVKVKYKLEGFLTQSISGLNYDPESSQKLIMTLRVSDYEKQEIVGVVTASCVYKNRVTEKIDQLLEMCVDELKGAE